MPGESYPTRPLDTLPKYDNEIIFVLRNYLLMRRYTSECVGYHPLPSTNVHEYTNGRASIREFVALFVDGL